MKMFGKKSSEPDGRIGELPPADALDKIQEKTNSGAICGDGMCPYVPCKNFPKCGHLEKQLTFEWEQEVISARKELALKSKRIAEEIAEKTQMRKDFEDTHRHSHSLIAKLEKKIAELEELNKPMKIEVRNLPPLTKEHMCGTCSIVAALEKEISTLKNTGCELIGKLGLAEAENSELKARLKK